MKAVISARKGRGLARMGDRWDLTRSECQQSSSAQGPGKPGQRGCSSSADQAKRIRRGNIPVRGPSKCKGSHWQNLHAKAEGPREDNAVRLGPKAKQSTESRQATRVTGGRQGFMDRLTALRILLSVLKAMGSH